MPNRNGVSPKQSAFAGFVADGDSYTEAYRKAYDADKMTDQTVWNASSRLAKNEKVAAYITALKKNDEVATQAHEQLSKEWILQRLQGEAENNKNPAATRVRALELLGKTSGLFDESTHITFENRTPEDVEKELVEKLAVLFPAEA
jgi:ribosomal protein S17E